MIVTIDSNTTPMQMHHLAVALQRIAAEAGYVASENITSISINPTPEQTAALDEMIKRHKSGVVHLDGTVEPLPPVTMSVREPGVIHRVEVVGTIEPPIVVTPPVTVNTLFLSDKEERDINITAVTDPHIDSAGLPWDARIHAGSRERNTDGSWRVRRKPKDTDQEEWNATLARVTSELRDLMEIPVSSGAVADAADETTLTDAEIDQFIDILEGIADVPGPFYWVHPESSCAGIVQTREELNEMLGEPLVSEIDKDEYEKLIEAGYARANAPDVAPPVAVAPVAVAPVAVAPPVVVAPPVIEPPVTAVAPPIATASPAIETFAQVMTFLTARTPKDETEKPAMVARVNEILAANGLTVLTQLGQRPDLIPQIMAQFTEAFGE